MMMAAAVCFRRRSFSSAATAKIGRRFMTVDRVSDCRARKGTRKESLGVAMSKNCLFKAI